MVFAIFREIAIPIIAIVVKNHIKDEFVKIQELTYLSFPQKSQFRVEMKFLGIQSSYKRFPPQDHAP